MDFEDFEKKYRENKVNHQTVFLSVSLSISQTLSSLSPFVHFPISGPHLCRSPPKKTKTPAYHRDFQHFSGICKGAAAAFCPSFGLSFFFSARGAMGGSADNATMSSPVATRSSNGIVWRPHANCENFMTSNWIGSLLCSSLNPLTGTLVIHFSYRGGEEKAGKAFSEDETLHSS